jgi:hypothetical protein
MSDQRESRACPYCGEDILSVAIKCKHCGSELSTIITSRIIEVFRRELKQRIEEIILSNKPQKTKKLFFAPEIPVDRLSRAREKYASKLCNNEIVLILGENKSMGFLYSGFVLTDVNLYYYGVNQTQNTLTGDPRKGLIPLHQIKSLEFKEAAFMGRDHFILNGAGPDEYESIPKCFEFGDVERSFLNHLFSGIQDLLVKLAREMSKGQPQASNGARYPASKQVNNVKSDNPIEVAEGYKPGCFKQGCLMVLWAVLGLIGIWALVVGLRA